MRNPNRPHFDPQRDVRRRQQQQQAQRVNRDSMQRQIDTTRNSLRRLAEQRQSAMQNIERQRQQAARSHAADARYVAAASRSARPEVPRQSESFGGRLLFVAFLLCVGGLLAVGVAVNTENAQLFWSFVD